MKKLTLSLGTILITSALAVGADMIVPIVTDISYTDEAVPSENQGFYLGMAYGYEKLLVDREKGANLVDEKFGSIMFDAGYKFNPYIAIEGRYWAGISTDSVLSWRTGIPADITVDAWGIYLKPMYPVSNQMNLYGLLGYGSSNTTYDTSGDIKITSDDTNGFSWGIGAEYDMTENWGVFLDYVSIITERTGNLDLLHTDDSLGTVNIGVKYQF